MTINYPAKQNLEHVGGNNSRKQKMFALEYVRPNPLYGDMRGGGGSGVKIMYSNKSPFTITISATLRIGEA